jgi:hypothetical protein
VSAPHKGLEVRGVFKVHKHGGPTAFLWAFWPIPLFHLELIPRSVDVDALIRLHRRRP